MVDTYGTQSLYEAAYLMARGFNLAGKESSGNKVTVFLKKTPEIDDEVMKFYNGGKIEAKKFCDQYRTLKDYIFTK